MSRRRRGALSPDLGSTRLSAGSHSAASTRPSIVDSELAAIDLVLVQSENPSHLVEAAASGDAVAIQSLLERHLPLAHALVRRRMGPVLRGREESADIVQSVCRRVLERGALYDHRDDVRFRRWLTEVVERKIVDRYRLLGAQKRDVHRESPPERTGAPPSPLSDEADGPSTVAERVEEVDLVRSALESMDAELSEALKLSAYEGLSYEAIAARLDCTPKQARRRVNKAKLVLGAALRSRKEH